MSIPDRVRISGDLARRGFTGSRASKVYWARRSVRLSVCLSVWISTVKYLTVRIFEGLTTISASPDLPAAKV